MVKVMACKFAVAIQRKCCVFGGFVYLVNETCVEIFTTNVHLVKQCFWHGKFFLMKSQ